jgi:hypothetical protein
MDIGTITRVNQIAKQGVLVPKKIPMNFNGLEIGDYVEGEIDVDLPARWPPRIVVDSGRDAPDLTFSQEGVLKSNDIDVIVADEIQLYHDTGVERDVPLDNPMNMNELELPSEMRGAEAPDREIMGTRGAEAPERDLMEMRGVEPEVTNTVAAEEQRYHYPILEESSRSSPVEAPWHLQGRPLMPDEGRSARVRRPPVRYTPDALMAEADVIEEVYNVVSAAYKHRESPLSMRKPYRPWMGANRVTLARAEASREKHESAYIISVRDALKQFGVDAEESLSNELTSLHVKGVFKQVMKKSLSPRQIKRVIRTKMFLKEKFKPSGKFDKLKSRYVAGGHMQHKDEYTSNETSSPTVT